MEIASCRCLQVPENGSVEGMQNIGHRGWDEMETDFLLSRNFPDVICLVGCVQVENQINWAFCRE
jgi:hypothetical protein